MYFDRPVEGLLLSAWMRSALFFRACEVVSATTVSAVTGRGSVHKTILILAATLAAFLSVGGVSDDAEIRGRVVRVADGDTIAILESVGSRVPRDRTSPAATQHKIRLYGIDAPESHQAFGQKSKQHLSSLVFGKDVRVKYKSRDKYGRILGIIYVDGLDINLEMLRAGLAWHYKRFDSTPAYAAAESDARQNRRGLWSDPTPIPPEQFRVGSRVPRDRSAAPTAASSRVEYRAGNALPVSSRTAAPVNFAWPDTGYWLSTNSNKRHNRNCENYRKTRGYPCTKDEGTPCGKCGGGESNVRSILQADR